MSFLQSLKMIINKCKSFGAEKFIISRLIFNRKVEKSILEQVNYELLQLCLKNGYHFIHNSSIKKNCANGSSIQRWFAFK